MPRPRRSSVSKRLWHIFQRQLGFTIVYTKFLLRTSSLPTDYVLDALGPWDEPGFERLRAGIFAFGVRVDVEFDFVSLVISQLLAKGTSC